MTTHFYFKIIILFGKAILYLAHTRRAKFQLDKKNHTILLYLVAPDSFVWDYLKKKTVHIYKVLIVYHFVENLRNNKEYRLFSYSLDCNVLKDRRMYILKLVLISFKLY